MHSNRARDNKTVEVCMELDDFLLVSHFTWWQHKMFFIAL